MKLYYSPAYCSQAVHIALRAVGDPGQVRIGDRRPYLLDLMAGRDPRQDGTYRYGSRWLIFDHIVVSPGLLDEAGWRVRPEALQVIRGTGRAPLRFGNERNPNPRGPSDHFAVVADLDL